MKSSQKINILDWKRNKVKGDEDLTKTKECPIIKLRRFRVWN